MSTILNRKASKNKENRNIYCVYGHHYFKGKVGEIACRKHRNERIRIQKERAKKIESLPFYLKG